MRALVVSLLLTGAAAAQEATVMPDELSSVATTLTFSRGSISTRCGYGGLFDDSVGMYLQGTAKITGGTSENGVGPTRPKKSLPGIVPDDFDSVVFLDAYAYTANEVLKVLMEASAFDVFRALALQKSEKDKSSFDIFRLRIEELRAVVKAQ